MNTRPTQGSELARPDSGHPSNKLRLWLWGFFWGELARICAVSKLWLQEYVSTGEFALRLFVLEEGSIFIAGFFLIPLVIKLVNRFKFRSDRWPEFLLIQLAGFFTIALLHSSMVFAIRLCSAPFLLGRAYVVNSWVDVYLMEVPLQLLAYSLVVTTLYYLAFQAEEREKALKFERLEARLNRMRLEVLRFQLNPHFLFNSLNAISSVLYQNPSKADRMIAHLGDFLRAVLASGTSGKHTLQAELKMLDPYLNLMRARSEQRLSLDFRVPTQLYPALIPEFCLQPLLENSLKAIPEERGLVELDCHREGDRLIIELRDNGSGLPPNFVWPPAERKATGGTGLWATWNRCRQLYGDRFDFALSNRPSGGCLALLEFPYEEAP